MNDKNRQQMLILAAVAVVAIFAGDKLVYSPLKNWWVARSERIAELRKKVTQGELLLTREKSIRDRWSQMLTNTLPPDNSLAEQQVIKALDTWSQDSRISVNSITPQWKRDADDVLTLECRVDASGSLSTITRFLYDLDKNPMALKLEAVEITARDNFGQQLSLGLQISGLVIIPVIP